MKLKIKINLIVMVFVMDKRRKNGRRIKKIKRRTKKKEIWLILKLIKKNAMITD